MRWAVLAGATFALLLLGCGGDDTTTIIQQGPPTTTTSTATTTTTPEPRYEVFVSCSLYTKDADDFCYGGDQPGANFRALDSDQVAYEMCVRSPSGEQTCTPGQTGLAGQLSKIPIDANELGLFHVEWKVAGTRRVPDPLHARGRRRGMTTRRDRRTLVVGHLLICEVEGPNRPPALDTLLMVSVTVVGEEQKARGRSSAKSWGHS